MIKILGLGPGDKELLTVGALDALKSGTEIFLRTEKHPSAEIIKNMNINFKTFDSLYEEYEDFNELYEKIAEELLSASQQKDIIYAVPGSPLVGEKSVTDLIKKCRENNIKYEIMPAVSSIEAVIKAAEADPLEGFKIIDAFEMDKQIPDKRCQTVITQVYNPFIAADVKLKLSEAYNDETEVYIVSWPGIKEKESVKKIKLYEMDMQDEYNDFTYLFIPQSLDNKKDFKDLLDIVEVLRSENGCPWDKVQTHESVKKALVEESYEVIDAIDNEDDDAMAEELGDVLLQVVFHASIGKEDEFFDINDVIEKISDKMIYRHPHVFGNLEGINTSEDILNKWDDLKKNEKGFASVSDEIDGIAKALPALMRAEKVQKKIEKAGFKISGLENKINLIKLAINRILDVYNAENVDMIEKEIGNLLFNCVNVARELGIEAELALKYSTEDFINKFKNIYEKESKNENLTEEKIFNLWNTPKN